MQIRVRYIFYGICFIIGFSLLQYFLTTGNSKNITAEDMYSYRGTKCLINYNIKQEVEDLQISTDGLAVQSQVPGASVTGDSAESLNADVAVVWSVIKDKSKENNLDPLWIAAYIAEETEFKNLPENSVGCIGYMQVSKDTAKSYNVTAQQLTDMTINIDTGSRMYRNLLDTSKAKYGVNDESNTLGKQYMYAQLLMGCWTVESRWSTTHEGYQSYNKIRRIYKEYVSGRRKVGDRCWDVIKDISVLGDGTPHPPMTSPETD